MELGVAYLWTEDYASASAHFESAIKDFPGHATSFYGMAGVSQWCLGQPSAAVADWRVGLTAQYADTSGLGIRLPLLLFVACILEPKAFRRSEAEGILQEKVKDGRARPWRGMLARFALGLADKEDCLALEPLTKDFERQHREWMVRFYQYLLLFGNGDLTPAQFFELMRRATDTSQPEFFDQNYFLSLMWSEEFFIARRQVQSACGGWPRSPE